MKFRIAKKIMTGRSSYIKRCRDLRPLQILDSGDVFAPSYEDIDKIRRASKVYFNHVRRKASINDSIKRIIVSCTGEDKKRGISDSVYIEMD